MPKSTEVHVDHKDYKSAVTGGKVSVKKLRSDMFQAKMAMNALAVSVREMEMELAAIIEEIGEDW